MKFNLLRFLMFLALPVFIVGAIIFSVTITEKMEEKGEFFIPENPIAHETATFTYQLINPSTKEPLHNASTHIEIVKTRAMNPWLNVGYLREDNHGTGLVYQSDSNLYDGKIELESIFWDAGSYELSIHATSSELQTPIEVKIPVEVKIPLGQILRAAILFLVIFIAAAISGHFARNLENPFKKKSSSSFGNNRTQTVLSICFAVILFSITLSNYSTTWAHGDTGGSNPAILTAEKSGVKAELKIDPMEPAQKGEPAHFILSFVDKQSNLPVQGIDASLSIYHEDDNITMLKTRSEIPNGTMQFDYAFPDTATFQLIVHAVPNSPQSTLTGPFDGNFSFEVPPVQPNAIAQIRAGLLMLIVLSAGFASGFFSTKRKKVTPVY